MNVWPWIPLTAMKEDMAWMTDVMQARRKEQRVSLRRQPRTTLELEHALTPEQYQAASDMLRDDIAVKVPAWHDKGVARHVKAWTTDDGLTMVNMTPWRSGKLWQSGVYWHNGEYKELTTVPDSTCSTIKGEAIVWTDAEHYAVCTVYDVVQHKLPATIYLQTPPDDMDGLVMQLCEADVPDGLEATHRGVGPQTVSISAILRAYDQPDGGTPVDTYKGLEVLSECTKTASRDEPISYALQSFDKSIGQTRYGRALEYPNALYGFRWFVTTPEGQCDLRRFMARRKGSQRAFWIADNLPLDVVSASGTLLTIRQSAYVSKSFFIELTTSGGKVRRQVMDAVQSLDGWQLTLDAAVPDASAAVRIRCVRLDSDRVTFTHHAAVGIICSTTLVECPLPDDEP